MSIHQQKVVQEQQELKDKLKAEKAEIFNRRQEIIEEQRSIHGRDLDSEVYEGPVPKASPYGSWKLVENTYVIFSDGSVKNRIRIRFLGSAGKFH